MAERLPIPPARIGEVATAALVSEATVRRYRVCNPDGSPVWRIHPGNEWLIERAVRALPADPQMELVASITAPEGDTSVDILADKSQLSTRGDCGIRGQAPVRGGGAETASIQPVHSEKPNDFTVRGGGGPEAIPVRAARPPLPGHHPGRARRGRDAMTNIARLFAEKMATDMIAPGGGLGGILTRIATPGLLAQKSREAKAFCELAVAAIRNAAEPNPWRNSTDEEIAGELLRVLDEKRKKGPTNARTRL